MAFLHTDVSIPGWPCTRVVPLSLFDQGSALDGVTLAARVSSGGSGGAPEASSEIHRMSGHVPQSVGVRGKLYADTCALKQVAWSLMHRPRGRVGGASMSMPQIRWFAANKRGATSSSRGSSRGFGFPVTLKHSHRVMCRQRHTSRVVCHQRHTSRGCDVSCGSGRPPRTGTLNRFRKQRPIHSRLKPILLRRRSLRS